MSPTDRLIALTLILCAGCRTTTLAVRPTALTRPVECHATAEVARLAEIAQVDLEAQEQLARVDALAERVVSLQQKLSTALGSGASGQEAQTTAEGAGVRVRLSDDLLFAPASVRITRRGRRSLDHVAEILRGTAVDHVEVAGHTDDLPIAHRFLDNWDLSMTRARSVVVYLIAHDVDPRRLRLVGYADTRPLALASSAEARARNRRVELLITPASPPLPAQASAR